LAAGAAVGCVAHAVRPIVAAAMTMAASGLFNFLIIDTSFSYLYFTGKMEIVYFFSLNIPGQNS
jgi:hypothetical protein